LGLRYAASLWSVAEVFAYPSVLLVLTPVFLGVVGTHGYALWVLAYSLAGFGSVANFGMGMATQKFVAQARGNRIGSHSMESAAVIAQSLVLAGIGGLVLGAVLILAAGALARAYFTKMGSEAEVILSIRVAGVVIACQQLESVFGSALRGLERFDLAAKAEAITKGGSGVVLIGAALLLRRVDALLVCTGVVACVTVAVKCLLVSRALQTPIRLASRPLVTAALLRFGFWAWLQGLAGIAFQQADRLLLSALFGAVALTTYSVASQIGGLFHAALSAGFAVFLPALSRRLASRDDAANTALISRAWRRAITLNVAAVFVLGGPLLIFGPTLLVLWLGTAASPELLHIYPAVLLAYLTLSLNVGAHFVLLGAGEARYVAIANAAGALIALGFLYPAVSIAGLPGAAFSRALYGIVLMVAYLIFVKRFESRR
jgi:O-antigen/teichoic acid export membrane protein